MRFVNTIEKHRREPGKSLGTYARERRLELAESIAGRHKIYLDTKYWLLLRDYSLNRPTEPAIAKLSTLLHHGVTSGALICPVSDGIFTEMSRQTDPKTLRKSAQLIDALSQGVSVLSREERIRMELLYFALTRRPGAPRYLAPKSSVWTKVAYVVGFAPFAGTPFSREDELVMQKAFLDQMWEMSLSDMFDTIGFEQMRHMPQRPDFSHPLNAEKFGRDPEDFGHAETALPYFDLFLTEHSLRHLLTRSDLALDRLYGCRVVSRPEAAIAEIESLVGRQTMSTG